MERGPSSGPRRTRSQMTADWTVSETLILVNEIASVEGDCLKALSSYQKWKIIAENCCALDVVRTSNQCRRKWDALLDDYRKIKQYESRYGHYSYGSLDRQKRNQSGLPDTFDDELFVAMGKFLEEQEDRSDTEPDSDPEAQTEIPDDDDTNLPGPKRQREVLVKVNPQDKLPEENTSRARAQVQNIYPEGGTLKCLPGPNGDPHGYSDSKRPRLGQTNATEEATTEENEEERLETVLQDSVKLIQQIVKESSASNCNPKSRSANIPDDLRGDFIRDQADKLIACLGSVVDSLQQFNQVCRGK